MIDPITEKLSEQHRGELKFCKLNADENPRRHEIPSQRHPLLPFFKCAQNAGDSLGVVCEMMIQPKVEALL